MKKIGILMLLLFGLASYSYAVTLDLNYTIDGGTATSSISWGTISFSEDGNGGINFTVDLVNQLWKIQAVGLNLDDKFSSAGIGDFDTTYFKVKYNYDSSFNPGGLGTFDLELKKDAASIYGTVSDTLIWTQGDLTLADIYPQADPEQGLLAAVHIGAIDGIYNGTNYGDDGSQAVGARENSVPPIPEPATFILLGSGLVGLAFFRRRQK